MVSVHRHVAVLTSMLEPGEAEQLWVAATFVGRDHRGALMVTDRRVLFTGLGAFTQTQEAFPRPLLTAMRVVPRPDAPRRTAAELHLDVLGDDWVFAGRPEDVDRAAAAIGPIATPTEPPASETEATTGDSVLDRLERLDRLHASGAISDTEFAAAKRRLLD